MGAWTIFSIPGLAKRDAQAQGEAPLSPWAQPLSPARTKILHELVGFEIGKPAFQFAGDADPDDASADDEEAAGCQAISLREKHGSGF